MSQTTDKLIDDIIELVLGDMDCQHEVDHDEDGVHMSAEYNLKDELKLRGKIEALLKPEVTEEWIEEKAERFVLKCPGIIGWHSESVKKFTKDFIRKLVEEIKK